MAKLSDNDQRILDLQATVQKKRAALKGQSTKFTPVTNCILTIDNIKLNLQVMCRDDLRLLMVRLNMYIMSAKDLGLTEPIVTSGYTIEQWIEDARARVATLDVKDKEKELSALEEKLKNLLSTDTKVSQEIDDLEALVNG